MRKPNKNKMAGVNSRFASVSELIFNGFLLKMLLRSLRVYILKQLFFSISANSGRIFTSPRIFWHYSPRFQRIIISLIIVTDSSTLTRRYFLSNDAYRTEGTTARLH